MTEPTTIAPIAIPSLRSALATLRSLLAVVPVDAAAKRALCGSMTETHRHYHGVGHLALLWRRHRAYAPEAGLDAPEVDRLVGSAIAYHDAVYESGRPDNETRSADLWWRVSENAPISRTERSWVAETIRATANHLNYAPWIACADETVALEERARVWMLDLDLTPFGEAPAAFDANTERLRAEGLHIATDVFEDGRMALLRRFDAAPRIFRSPVLARVFEDAARRNITRAMAVPSPG